MTASLFSLLEAAKPESTLLRLSSENRSVRYGQLERRSAQFAAALADLGCGPGDRVIVQVEKTVDALALYFACLRAAIVYVPLNTAYTASEVAYFVKDAQASLVVCQPEREDELCAVLNHLATCRLITLGNHGQGSLAAHADGATPHDHVVEVNAQTIACMLYTSGTTGRSKGALLSHGCLRSNAAALYETWSFCPGDVLLHALPIFHVHGLFVALSTAMLGGHTLIYLERFSVDGVIEELPNATVFMGVPTYYTRLLADARFNRDTCQNVRLFTSGSAPMTTHVHQTFTERTGHTICERYGMTECGIITSNPYDGDRIAGTVGYALPGYEVRVRNATVEVRGEHLFSGYWHNADKTREAFTEDGWFITGDVGTMEADGRLALEGRASDMIISGGYNIYPKEIEIVIDEVEGIEESAVIGTPHADFGEGVVAVLVLKPGFSAEEAELRARAHCQTRLARFKHPKRWMFVESLPRNAMSKVQKNELRACYAHIFETEQLEPSN